VVAPSLRPQKAGDRVNTARRDAGPGARRARSGALPSVDVPPVEDAAIRDRARARDDPRSALQAATCRLNACWRRPDRRDTGRAHWPPAHLRWLAAGGGATPAQHLAFPEDVRALNAHPARLQRLAPALQAQVTTWRRPPGVAALAGLRGGPCTVAVTRVAERGDLTRVEHPRHVRQELGLIPSAYPSGARRRQGALTQAGNAQARRAPVEGAWAYREPAHVRRHVHLRLATRPQPRQDLSWTAQVRLGPRFRRRMARGQHPHHVGVAMARALAGFLRAIATGGP
jgi:transposase